MKYNFDDIANLYNSSSSRYDGLKKDELALSIADMDFKVLPEIADCLRNRISVEAYPYVDVPEEFYDSFINYSFKRHNLKIKRDWLIFSTSVIASLDNIFSSFLNESDSIALFSPIYNTFYSCINNHKLNLVEIPFILNKDKYEIDFLALNKTFESNKIKLFLLCNPHNPGGKIFSYDEVKKIVDLAKQYNVIVLSDEIHCDISDPDKEYCSLLNFINQFDNLIVLNSASKSFNLAGLQTSVVICPNSSLKERIKKELYKNDVGEPNFFGPYASLSAWKYGLEWNKELRMYLYQNKQYLNSLNLAQYGVTIVDGGATYLLWLKLPERFKSSNEFVKDLYLKKGIKVCPGIIYGKDGEGFIRINIATSLKNVVTFANRFIDYIKKA